MTKQEWLDCNDIDCLLREKFSKRKIVLFLVALASKVTHLLQERESGLISAKQYLNQVEKENCNIKPVLELFKKAYVRNRMRLIFEDLAKPRITRGFNLIRCDIANKVEIFKDICNPFLDKLTFPRQAIEIAQQVYDTKDEDAKFVLSDCLEEYGFPEEIHTHLRTGEHPKGCWLIDQILNNK